MKLKSRTVNDVVIEESSGNVFADLGFPNPEEHLVKVELVSKIDQLVEVRGLTQVEAAKLLGVKQPDLCKLLRGRVRGYSVDRLLRFLAALDQDVEIVIRPAQPGNREERHGRISVTALS
jgi:predicted XRE-type DNA-binding protein